MVPKLRGQIFLCNWHSGGVTPSPQAFPNSPGADPLQLDYQGLNSLQSATLAGLGGCPMGWGNLSRQYSSRSSLSLSLLFSSVPSLVMCACAGLVVCCVVHVVLCARAHAVVLACVCAHMCPFAVFFLLESAGQPAATRCRRLDVCQFLCETPQATDLLQGRGLPMRRWRLHHPRRRRPGVPLVLAASRCGKVGGSEMCPAEHAALRSHMQPTFKLINSVIITN